ncbi:MAG: sulfurtransferase-like selenium metabolism protein YedF, partial [Synergistaceae bacterium]|nr:sulfurtransferase-like selenium metabolism protein YedF [Synergistaceae bacterium]
MKIVDAKGQLCPKPVMMTREATEAGERELAVIVDNEVSALNVRRFLENAGYRVSRTDADGVTRIEAVLPEGTERREEAGPAPEAGPKRSDYAYLILSSNIGAQSDGLGEVLMKSFLGTIGSRRPRPRAIALMNDGVKLALSGETSAETLKELESDGVTVLVCGTCTKHFGITDDIAVGQISNMFEITETVFGAS